MQQTQPLTTIKTVNACVGLFDFLILSVIGIINACVESRLLVLTETSTTRCIVIATMLTMSRAALKCVRVPNRGPDHVMSRLYAMVADKLRAQSTLQWIGSRQQQTARDAMLYYA
jgi:hypothetical protein